MLISEFLCYGHLNSTVNNVTKSHKLDKVKISFYKAYFIDKKNEEKRSTLPTAWEETEKRAQIVTSPGARLKAHWNHPEDSFGH